MSFDCETAERKSTRAAVPKAAPFYTAKNFLVAALLTAGYLLLSAALVGFRTDQVVLAGIFNALYFGSPRTRQFILAFSVFIVYWILFDYQKAFPNYELSPVHIQDLYNWEKAWFGMEWQNKLVTPNEYFVQNTHPVVDLVTGIFYLCWIPVPFAFAAVMFFKNRNLYFQFALSFVAVNLLGWMGYYFYPAAPPWYVAQYGFDFVAQTPGNTAGLARFDALTGVPVFDAIYAKSSNVFAAMPSLHAAYMLIVAYYAARHRMRWFAPVAFVITAGIWFGAVYSGHHYVLDVLAGIGCAIAGIAVFQWWARSKAGRSTLAKWSRPVG